jgi:hypothetical protein
MVLNITINFTDYSHKHVTAGSLLAARRALEREWGQAMRRWQATAHRLPISFAIRLADGKRGYYLNADANALVATDVEMHGYQGA